jgi:hypothetical protein
MVTTRYVPLSLSLKCIFGGGLGILGWVFLAIGAFIIKFLIPSCNAVEPIYFWSGSTRAAGIVTGIEGTSVSEGGGKNSKGRPVNGYRFEYEAGGEKLNGISYSSTETPVVGSQVEVEYSSLDSSKARIVGMRGGVVHWALGVVFSIFPLLGAYFVYRSMKKGLKAVNLFKTGTLTKGKLTGQQRTNVVINNSPVIEYSFEFKARDGRNYYATERTHIPDKITDQSEEELLYDTENPSIALLLDALPGRPQFDGAGNITSSSGSMLALLVPGITISIYALLFGALEMG